MLNAAIVEQRPRRPPPRRSLSIVLALSALFHALALLIVILLVPDSGAPPAQGEPGPAMEMVFSGGADEAQPQSAASSPEMNLLPPEMQQDEASPPLPPQNQPAPFHLPPQAYARRPAHAAPNPFAHPMQLGFGPPTAGRPRGPSGGHGLDLSVGPVISGGQMSDAVAHISSPNASADWGRDVEDWIESHKYYPPQAAENGEEGTSVIVATIARDGRVKSARLISSSGSQWLDLGTLAIFRGQKLPPFPDDMKVQEVTVELNMDYTLIRR